MEVSSEPIEGSTSHMSRLSSGIVTDAGASASTISCSVWSKASVTQPAISKTGRCSVMDEICMSENKPVERVSTSTWPASYSARNLK